jgi:long-chain fatty acid transport protein
MRFVRPVTALCLGLAAPLFAQLRTFSKLDFNIGAPGGRALGMGGAFIGLADDASATWTNPAGLSILRKPELSIEMRSSNFHEKVAAAGDATHVQFETIATARRSPDITHAAIVIPLKKSALAVFYRKTFATDISARLDNPVSVLIGPGGAVTPAVCNALGSQCVRGAIPAERSSLIADQEALGLATALQFPRFSVGASVAASHLQLTGSGRQIAANGNTVGSSDIAASDTKYQYALGVKWAPIDVLGLGATYARASSFRVNGQAASSITNVNRPISFLFGSPDYGGVGVAFRPIATLTLTSDVIKVRYSKLVKNYVEFTQLPKSDFQLSDGTEYHFGTEYFILSHRPFAVRAGAWREPGHSVAYRGETATFRGIAADLTFLPSRSELHWTAGAGWALQRFEVDAAYDHSPVSHVASLWFVARF